MNNIIYIYTDGACKGNPGIGGWGALIMYNSHKKEIWGKEDNTTNNRMELTAVIEALKVIKNPVIPIIIITDSQYVKNGIETWIHNWKINNWRTSSKSAVKNDDLWKQLDSLSQNFNIKWQWVKSHSGHTENERADYLANLALFPTSTLLEDLFDQ